MLRTLALASLTALALGACVSSTAATGAGSTAALTEPNAVPVPIYRELLVDSPTPRYFFSTRTSAEAERFGWRQLGIAFFAYITPVPGTVPVYCETPASAPHSDYRFSTRPEGAALEEGWMRLNLAFYAFPDARVGTVPVALESPLGSTTGPFGLAVRNASAARGFGVGQIETAFYAIDAEALTSAAEARRLSPVGG